MSAVTNVEELERLFDEAASDYANWKSDSPPSSRVLAELAFTALAPATTRDVGFEDARIVILELLTIPGVRLYVQPEQMLKALVAAGLRATP